MPIAVDPNELRNLAHAISRESASINEIAGKVNRIISSLDWEVRAKANIEGSLGKFFSSAQATINDASELAEFLERRANAFSEADNRDYFAKHGLPGTHFYDGESYPGFEYPWYVKVAGVAKWAWLGTKIAWTYKILSPAMKWSGTLTKETMKGIVKDLMANSTLSKVAPWVSVALEAPTLYHRIHRDWNQYQDPYIKTSAIGIDVAESTVTVAAGLGLAKLGAALGTAICPGPGTVIGAGAGGLLGIGAGYLVNRFDVSGYKVKAIKWTSERIRSFW